MKSFNSLMLSLVLVALSATALAQNPPIHNPLELPYSTPNDRNEIIIPSIKGMNVYKADLHIHTTYSDGDVTPDMRVVEAWKDGLDVIAITDHMEYRRIEREMFKYMKDYIREDLRGTAAVNTNVLKKAPDERGLLVDFNVSYESAAKKARDYGIFVVKGVEITRSKLGDYNALFTTDNNKIYDPDLEQTIRNAREQGAFIVHNHPMYSNKTENTITPFTNDLYAKGLIDGVEIMNGRKIYYHLFSHCIGGGYTPFGNSDAHDYIYWKYGTAYDSDIPRYRNMTMILAEECTEAALHQALKDGNTIAYSNNNLVGKCDLLQALFEESVEFELQRAGSKSDYITLRNRSSLPYFIQIGKNQYIINAMGSLFIKRQKGDKFKVTVLNMWYGNNDHPEVTVELK